jgi:hypothetical protein
MPLDIWFYLAKFSALRSVRWKSHALAIVFFVERGGKKADFLCKLFARHFRVSFRQPMSAAAGFEVMS